MQQHQLHGQQDFPVAKVASSAAAGEPSGFQRHVPEQPGAAQPGKGGSHEAGGSSGPRLQGEQPSEHQHSHP